MANLMTPFTPDEIKKIPISEVREAYNSLAKTYNKIINGEFVFCHKCNTFHIRKNFYTDSRYLSGLFPDCKQSLLKEATDYDEINSMFLDNREKAIEVFRKMDIPFIEPIYRKSLNKVSNLANELNRKTAFLDLITYVKSLPQYNDKTFAHSEFLNKDGNDEFGEIIEVRGDTKKFFGRGFSKEDYAFLQDKYDDFKQRASVDSISQEIYVKQICLQLLDIDKDRKVGKDVTNKLKALDVLMSSANLQPKQNVGNASTDTLTFGQLIEKWELEKPIPEPTEEFKDVDKIGKYIRVWFMGWMGRALGLNNAYTEECEEEIKKYTVSKNNVENTSEESSQNSIYEQIFGSETE